MTANFKNAVSSPNRLILLVTHNCQLRCGYCRVKKFSDSMNEKVLFKAIDLLFGFNREKIQLQFFGGEPLLEFDLIKKGVEYAEKLNKKSKKDLNFILTTNGILLNKEKINFFKKHKFLIECSIDKEKMRRQKDYAPAIKNFDYLFRSGIPHYSISVFGPNDVSSMSQNFKYLIGLGFKKIQLNYCLGIIWKKEKIKELLNQFERILNILKSKKDVQLINLALWRKEPVILNGELTVDCNGDLYLEFGGFLERDFLSLKKRFFIENIKNIRDCSFRSLNLSQRLFALLNGYPEKTIRKIIFNNIAVGKTIEKFLRKFKNENNR